MIFLGPWDDAMKCRLEKRCTKRSPETPVP
jgi:hypothetical protein